jgi:hypothetical protein
MSCPDEDTFARFVEGRLGPEEAAEIERHVDGCARCADLGAEFGRLFAEGTVPPAPEPRRPGAWLELLVAVLHAAWAAVLWRALPVLGAELPPGAATVYLRYAEAWALAGAPVALVAAAGLAVGARWGRALAVAHALLSLPSVVLTPLAVVALWVVLGKDGRPGVKGSGVGGDDAPDRRARTGSVAPPARRSG